MSRADDICCVCMVSSHFCRCPVFFSVTADDRNKEYAREQARRAGLSQEQKEEQRKRWEREERERETPKQRIDRQYGERLQRREEADAAAYRELMGFGPKKTFCKEHGRAISVCGCDPVVFGICPKCYAPARKVNDTALVSHCGESSCDYYSSTKY